MDLDFHEKHKMRLLLPLLHGSVDEVLRPSRLSTCALLHEALSRCPVSLCRNPEQTVKSANKLGIDLSAKVG